MTSFSTSLLSTTTSYFFLDPGDIDGDGDLDMLASERMGYPYSRSYIYWLENNGQSPPEFTKHSVGERDGYQGDVCADLDNDGDLDLLGGGQHSGHVTWFENDGAASPSFKKHIVFASLTTIYDIFADDLDGDGDIDFIPGAALWYENDGDSPPSFREHRLSDNPYEIASVWVADLDGDGDKDVLGDNMTSPPKWYENDGNSTPSFIPHDILNFSKNSRDRIRPRTADFNNDGNIDIIGIADWFYIRWLENDGAPNPTFTSHTLNALTGVPRTLITQDIDGDGDIDIISSQRTSNTITWHENDGSSTPSFTPHIIDRPVHAYTTPRAGDFDADGDLDLISASSSGIFFHENNGYTTPSLTLLASGVTGTSYTFSGPLENAKRCFWKVVARNSDGATTSSLWSFTTEEAPPSPLAPPYPAWGPSPRGDTWDLPVAQEFSWKDRGLTDSFDFYLWKASELRPPLPFAADLTTGAFAPPQSLDYATTYIWQIVSKNVAGETAGISWTFTTAAAEAALLSPLEGYDLADDTEVTITGTARNIDGDLADFSWRLEFQKTGEAQWTALATGDSEKSEAVLAHWTIGYSLAPGFYTLRLTVTNDYGSSVVERQLVNTLRPPAIPELRTPANGLADIPIYGSALDWLDSARAEGYEVIYTPSSPEITFTQHLISTRNSRYKVLKSADLDGDADIDFVLFEHFYSSSPPPAGSTFLWYENDGGNTPTFTTHSINIQFYWLSPWELPDIELVDIDGDDDIDIFFSDGFRWLENDGAVSPSFIPHAITSTFEKILDLHAVDINGDGHMDIVVQESYEYGDGRSAWYENDGAARPLFRERMMDSPSPGGRGRFSSAYMDGDNDLDLLRDRGYYGLSWHENLGGNPTLFISRLFPLPFPDRVKSEMVLPTDLDGDGDIDVVVRNEHYNYKDDMYWLENLNETPISFTRHKIITSSGKFAQNRTGSIIAEDFDHDGDADLVLFESTGEDSIRLLKNDGSSTPTFTMQDIPSEGYLVNNAAEDIDRDGDLDLFLASSSNLYWIENKPTSASEVTSVEKSFLTPPPFAQNTTYTWQVRAWNGAGAIVSPLWTFSTTTGTLHTIHASRGANGVIEPSGEVFVLEGEDLVFTLTPDAHYHVADILVDGLSEGSSVTYKFPAVAQEHTIHALFALDAYALNTPAENGQVARSPDLALYPHGTTVTLEAVPESGYLFKEWSGDVPANAKEKNPMVIIIDAEKSITAIFDKRKSPTWILR